MRRKFGIFVSVLLTLTTLSSLAGDSPTFRGPDRNGHYPETGLMKSWPESGPKELWSANGLGEAYASVAVVDGKVYTTGKIEDEGFLFAFDENGKELWKVSYGAEGDGGKFPGSRSTPTIDKGDIFITSGPGLVLCFSLEGKKKWEVNIAERFGGAAPHFDYSESVLLDGNNIICTPGGKDATVVALDRKNGETVWTSKGLSDAASYCSARIYDNGKHRQILTMTGKAMVGLDPTSGELLWRQPYEVKYDIHANTPVYSGNMIYISDGYGEGGAMFELADDGRSVTERWTEDTLDVHHGGAVLVNGYIYGASNRGEWKCLDLKTGEIKSSHKDLGKGAAVFADGMIYGYDEKGNVGIMKADPANFGAVSSFKITKGEAQHWSHPVISNGRLYIRHGSVLMCFEIKSNES